MTAARRHNVESARDRDGHPWRTCPQEQRRFHGLARRVGVSDEVVLEKRATDSSTIQSETVRVNWLCFANLHKFVSYLFPFRIFAILDDMKQLVNFRNTCGDEILVAAS